MKLLAKRISKLDLINNVEEGANMNAKIDVSFRLLPLKDVSFRLLPLKEEKNRSFGEIQLSMTDTNDENDYPFKLDIDCRGILEYIPGENVDKQAFECLFAYLKEYVSDFFVGLGYPPLELPDIKLKKNARQIPDDNTFFIN